MDLIKYLGITLIFTLTIMANSVNSYAEENIGQAIYSRYKNAIVDIDVKVELKDGTIKHKRGSGFFVDKEGYVLTDTHVVKTSPSELKVKDASFIKKISHFAILTSKNRKYRAHIVGSNDKADIALLKVANINPADYVAVKIGDPKLLRVGDKDWAIGNPKYLANSLTAGNVSYLHRHIGLNYIEDFIQTDCPINFGNSGCPVFNSNEEVIAITQAIYIESDGLAFAASIDIAKINLLKRGDINLPSIGFEALLDNFPRDGKSAEAPGLEDLQTLKTMTDVEDIENLMALGKSTYVEDYAIVISVDDFEDPKAVWKVEGPAKKAGIQKGDLIVSLDGKIMHSGMDIRIFLMDKRAGDSVTVVYKRPDNGVMTPKIARVVLAARPTVTAPTEDED
jgi:S1-C subfamily serine protease